MWLYFVIASSLHRLVSWEALLAFTRYLRINFPAYKNTDNLELAVKPWNQTMTFRMLRYTAQYPIIMYADGKGNSLFSKASTVRLLSDFGGFICVNLFVIVCSSGKAVHHVCGFFWESSPIFLHILLHKKQCRALLTAVY